MSLKAFHIFFVALSAILCLGIGAARLSAYTDGAGVAALVQAIVALVAGLGLLAYGWRFLKTTKNLGYLVFVLLLFAPVTAQACSVCFGDPGSSQTKAMKAGILVLLGCIGSLLAGFGGLFLYWMSRSRRLSLKQEEEVTL